MASKRRKSNLPQESKRRYAPKEAKEQHPYKCRNANCKRNAYPNRFFCPACHTRLTTFYAHEVMIETEAHLDELKYTPRTGRKSPWYGA